MTLKNQQASISEAQYSSQLGVLSFEQSRSIMVFTVVTIIFLPLSFMSSVFGMNAKEFSSPDGGNSMSLKDQFKLLCRLKFCQLSPTIPCPSIITRADRNY